MLAAIEALRRFSFATAALRLVLAMLSGGVVGYGRTKKARSAGLRTYMLISIGAAMAVLLTQFQYEMLNGPWAAVTDEVGLKFDASRMASSVITGIGFLGAGIIIKVAHQQVNGLTTSTGLFATVIMGLAAGAGFYEGVIVSMLLIVVVLNVMSPLEIAFKRRLRNITLNVEFASVEDIGAITEAIEAEGAKVYDIDVERTERKDDKYPSAIFILQLSRDNHSHSGMLTSVAELACVRSVQELIS
ncbi:MAG: MgtC/SapB family protein [Clostridia bacterium]|nr:MgtC/SapB family protein [Clostridia bacterium]